LEEIEPETELAIIRMRPAEPYGDQPAQGSTATPESTSVEVEVEPVTNRLPIPGGDNGPVTLRSPQGPVPTPEPTPRVMVETPQYGPEAADDLVRGRGGNPYPQQPLPNPDADLPGYVPESQVNPGSTQMPPTEMPATEIPATEMPATEPALPPE